MLCLSGFELYSRWVPLTFSISTRRKKNKAVVLHPFWFIQVEVLAYYYACNTFSILTRSRKKIRQLFYILSGSSR